MNSIYKKGSMLILMGLFLLLATPSWQVHASEVIPESKISSALTNIQTFAASEEAEETEIHFATDQYGRVWYRVWSLTYGRWNTDWIMLV